MTKMVTGLLAFVLAISTVTALKCYKCDSSQSNLCGLGGVTRITYPSEECTGDTFLTNWVPKECVKIVAKDKEGKQYVARGCAPSSGGICNAIVKTMGFFSNVDLEDTSCHTCDGDNCNSAQTFTGFTFLGVVLAIFTFMF